MMQYHIKPLSLGRSKPTQRIAVLGVLLMGLMGVSSPVVAADEPWATLRSICANNIDFYPNAGNRKTCLKNVIELASMQSAYIAKSSKDGNCNPYIGDISSIDACTNELLSVLSKSQANPDKAVVIEKVCIPEVVKQQDACKAKVNNLSFQLKGSALTLVTQPSTEVIVKNRDSPTTSVAELQTKINDAELQTKIDNAVKKALEDEKNGLSLLSLVISLLALGAVFYSRHTQTHTNMLQSTGQAAPISQIPQKPITQPNQNLGLTLGQQQQISRLIEEQLKLQQQGLLAKLKQEIDSKLEEAIPIIPIQPITIVDTFKAMQPDVILTPQQPSPVKQPPEKLVTADLQQLLSLYQTWAKDSRGMISLKDWLPPPINEKLERLGYQICCWKAGREVDLMIVDTSPPTATKAVGIIRIQDKQGYAYCLTKTHSVAQIWQAQTWYKVTQQGEQLQQIAEISV